MRQSCFVMIMRGVIVRSNYPYVGDHPAEPPSVSDCDFCDGFGLITCLDTWKTRRCEHCQPDEPDHEPECYPD